jgi:TonB family protein
MGIKKIIKLLILVIIVFWITTALSAAGDILVGFRLYKGIKGNETENEKPSVVTSYHLRPLFVGNLITETGMREEKEELKRIFNLADLELVSRSRMVWQENDKMTKMGFIILNGHKFAVNISSKKEKDLFKLEVIEKSETGSKELLGTEIILPETKTAVFGFEDSLKKAYFLSFHRESDKSVILQDMTEVRLEEPRLITGASPDYPKVAKLAGIEGNVILEASTDLEGNVVDLNVIKGQPLLRKAAMNAVKQWKYEPYRVKGKARPAAFTVTVYFRLYQAKGKKAEKMRQYVGNPITVTFKDAPLKDVLQFFEKAAGVTIETDPGISAWVMCDFHAVPWDEALQLILRLNGLEMIQVGKTLNIRKSAPGAPMGKPAFNKAYTGEPMDFDFKNANLSSILKFTSNIMKTDVILDPGIDGAISCRMNQMPLDEALDLMLKVNDLYVIKDGDKMRVRKIEHKEDKKSASIPNIWPTMGYLTDIFGERKNPITGKEEFHFGIDIAARKGTEVVSPAAGVVVLAENEKNEGNLIVIDHRNGYTSRYGRLDSFKVKKGDTVKKGDVIGYVGSTGMSTAPHLHWEVRFNDKPINPITLLTDD